MVRVPAGLNVEAGALRATGQAPVRPQAVPMRHYWRRTTTGLHAGAQAVFSPHGQVGPVFRWVATAGPQGTGEQWLVDLVQVQFPSQYGAAPLVVQQTLSQIAGTSTVVPPPFVARAWLAVAGTLDKMLAQTTQGGNDALSVSCPLLAPGEAVAVEFWGPLANGVPWMALRGTRYALSVT